MIDGREAEDDGCDHRCRRFGEIGSQAWAMQSMSGGDVKPQSDNRCRRWCMNQEFRISPSSSY
jgi:hypothetical protein